MSQALVCRYHGWTYRLDGSLAHVPHADGFPDLHMPSRGLVEVASREIGGLVVIDGLDSHATTAVMAALTDGSPWRDKLPAARRLVFAESAVRAINWKVLVEQFLEGYHIRSTHRDTFFPLQYDNLNIVERFGPNSRITFPYRNIERLRNRPESTWTVDRRVTFVYHLFPNVMLATFPNQVIMVVIDPIDIDHSATTTYAMADQVPDRDGAPSLIDRGAFETTRCRQPCSGGYTPAPTRSSSSASMRARRTFTPTSRSVSGHCQTGERIAAVSPYGGDMRVLALLAALLAVAGLLVVPPRHGGAQGRIPRGHQRPHDQRRRVGAVLSAAQASEPAGVGAAGGGVARWLR